MNVAVRFKLFVRKLSINVLFVRALTQKVVEIKSFTFYVLGTFFLFACDFCPQRESERIKDRDCNSRVGEYATVIKLFSVYQTLHWSTPICSVCTPWILKSLLVPGGSTHSNFSSAQLNFLAATLWSHREKKKRRHTYFYL